MKYALIENGVVVNLIRLHPMNASDFPGAVALDGIPAAIGDAYDGESFYHEGKRLLSRDQEMQNEITQLDQALLDLAYQQVIGGIEE